MTQAKLSLILDTRQTPSCTMESGCRVEGRLPPAFYPPPALYQEVFLRNINSSKSRIKEDDQMPPCFNKWHVFGFLSLVMISQSKHSQTEGGTKLPWRYQLALVKNYSTFHTQESAKVQAKVFFQNHPTISQCQTI